MDGDRNVYNIPLGYKQGDRSCVECLNIIHIIYGVALPYPTLPYL